MIATLTNTSGAAMHYLDSIVTGTGMAGGTAYGGSRKYPLPHPFDKQHQPLANAIAGLANGATMVYSVGSSDFERQFFAGMQSPRDQLNLLIQAGKITITYGAATGYTDTAEAFFHGV